MNYPPIKKLSLLKHVPFTQTNTTRMGDESFPLPAPTPPIPHTDLIRLIGEIDGISLEGDNGQMKVTIRIHGREICIISDYAESPSHHITREGIRDVLARNLI